MWKNLSRKTLQCCSHCVFCKSQFLTVVLCSFYCTCLYISSTDPLTFSLYVPCSFSFWILSSFSADKEAVKFTFINHVFSLMLFWVFVTAAVKSLFVAHVLNSEMLFDWTKSSDVIVMKQVHRCVPFVVDTDEDSDLSAPADTLRSVSATALSSPGPPSHSGCTAAQNHSQDHTSCAHILSQ